MGSILSTKNVRIAPTDMPWRCRPQEKGSCCCLGPTIYFGHRSKQTRRLIIPKRLQIAGWQEGEANELCHTLSHSLAFRGPASLGRPAKLLGLQMPHSAPLPQVLFPPPSSQAGACRESFFLGDSIRGMVLEATGLQHHKDVIIPRDSTCFHLFCPLASLAAP